MESKAQNEKRGASGLERKERKGTYHLQRLLSDRHPQGPSFLENNRTEKRVSLLYQHPFILQLTKPSLSQTEEGRKQRVTSGESRVAGVGAEGGGARGEDDFKVTLFVGEECYKDGGSFRGLVVVLWTDIVAQVLECFE